MRRVAVNVFGTDRPGIVATVTGVLMAHGGNLEDTTMTILRGHFSMMLVVAVPGDEGAVALEQALTREMDERELVVTVRPLAGGPDAGPGRGTAGGGRWSISLLGADRPGIVHRVTRLLADQGANVTDLTTRLVGDEDGSEYVMMLEVALPAGGDADRLDADLEGLAHDLGVEIHLRPHEAGTPSG